MDQISEGSTDAQNIAKNLVEAIVGEAYQTSTHIVNEEKESHFDSFESMKLQNFGNEEIVSFVKSEEMNLEECRYHDNLGQESINGICYQNLPEVCIHSSTISTLGEGDFQPPFVRETKAFHHLRHEGIGGNDQSFIDSSQSSVNTSFTEELIAQLHCDINNISFDNIHLSDSEVEKESHVKEIDNEEEESLTQDGEETKEKMNQSCQTNSTDHFENYADSTNHQDNHELKRSPKFSHLSDMFNQYFILKGNCDETEIEEQEKLLPTNSEELLCIKSKEFGYADKFSQTNSSTNPFLSSNVNSTIALSPDCCKPKDTEDELCKSSVFADMEEIQENSEWVEANEVEIRITEPGCSKDFLQMQSSEEVVDVIRTRPYWSNVGLMTERTIDRRYIGPVEIPGIEAIKGVKRVEEKYMTHEPEEIIWVTEAETSEENVAVSTNQNLPKENDANYLSFPEKTETRKTKKKIASRLTRAISSIFKLNKRDSKE